MKESVIAQILLETMLEAEQDGALGGGNQWALQEVRSLVCSYLHQAFIADTMLAKLVHFQGYPSELLETTVKGIPSMHICLDFVFELMQQNRLSTVIFAVQLLAHLSIQYALPKSLNLCVTAVNLLYTLAAGVSSEERYRVFAPLLPALVRISEAFPALCDDVIQVLMQLGRMCVAQMALVATTGQHTVPQKQAIHCRRSIAGDNRELLALIKCTFQQLLGVGGMVRSAPTTFDEGGVLKTNIYGCY